jgi:hypothetical protein
MKKNKLAKILLGLSIILSPALALAQVEELFSRVASIINSALSLVIPIAVIAVIIVGYQYITSGGSPEQMTKAKNNLIWIIIGLVVIILAKGLIIFVLSSLGVKTSIFNL